MKILLVVPVALLLVGCQGFAQGFRDESARQLADITADVIEKKLGDDFKDVSDGLKKLPDQLPKDTPAQDGALYTLGAIVAYIVGSAGKGFLRSKMTKKDG